MRVTRKGKGWRSEAEWQQMCTRFAQSGLEPQEFCQREAIARDSFKNWYHRCAEKGLTAAAFVEGAPVRPEGWAVESELPSGVRLQVRGLGDGEAPWRAADISVAGASRFA